MKKFFLLVLTIGVLVVCAMFGGLHIGTPCAADAKDFATHIGETGSNHLPEFGGAQGAIDFLNKVAAGQIAVNVYGDEALTMVAASSSPYGPVLLIYGKSVLPTMYTTDTSTLNLRVQGKQIRTGKADLNAAKNAAGCFSGALASVYAPASAPATLPVSGSAMVIGAIIVLVLGGGLLLGGRKVLPA